jgi:tetratricopeptide (TPR) repeat protein
MIEGLALVGDRIEQADLARSEGDTNRNQGNEEAAVAAFSRGVGLLDEALAVLNGPPWHGLPDAGGDVDAEALADSIEALGARGGLLKRLGDLTAARASYEEGAALERRFHHPSTYNRLNAVKCAIRLGGGLTPSLPAIREIADTLDRMLDAGDAEGESGWTWVDLADCRALLGDLDAAASAYQRFIDLSQTQSPQTALRELRNLQATLQQATDPGAESVEAAITLLEQRLHAAR